MRLLNNLFSRRKRKMGRPRARILGGSWNAVLGPAESTVSKLILSRRRENASFARPRHTKIDRREEAAAAGEEMKGVLWEVGDAAVLSATKGIVVQLRIPVAYAAIGKTIG